jgi:branched-chain amino acid transport system ATP-binding protein
MYMAVVLEADKLVKAFGGVVAVSGVSFRLEQGEIRGVIGPNGSGKTTLINLIAGFHEPDSGALLLNGSPIQTLRPEQRMHLGVMRTFQIPRLFGDMTVIENLLVPALASGMDGSGRKGSAGFSGALIDARRRADDALEFGRMTHVRDLPARYLSGGQKMLVQILRGLMAPKLDVFVMDEPFTGINPVLKETIIDAILKLNRERNTTFLIISHEMSTIRRMCKTISVMHNGSVLAEGPLEELAGNPQVTEAYLGATDVLARD